jgi:hypothetical protein
MRYLIAALLFIHALLHLLGFQWGRVTGLVWSVASLALLAAALMLALDRDGWWWVAAVGLVMSQALVMSAWSAARAGTVVNLLLAIPVALAAAQSHFHSQSDAAVMRLLSRVPASPPSIVTAAEVANLPSPVRRWLEGAGVIGQPRIQVARLHQKGAMRTALDQPWLEAHARQYFSVDPPSFVWEVTTKMKGLPVIGRDSYEEGHGRMLITAFGLVKLVDGRGAKIDQGTLLRYLAETIWLPTAALAPYIEWQPIDDTSARATMSHGGVSGTAVFTFDEQGRMLAMTADRYRGDGASATLERWSARMRAWGRRGGLLVPVAGTVGWKLKTGDFDYYDWEITDLEFNRSALQPLRPAATPEVPVAYREQATLTRRQHAAFDRVP